MDLKQLLKDRHIIILDGAVGTELDKLGCASREDANLTNPEVVRHVHGAYIDAGSLAIITNTLTMNRLFIESHGLRIDVQQVNREGVRIAKQVLRNKGYVLGNLSSTGQLLEPYGTYQEQAFLDTFKEQARYLDEEGVDGFIIETIMDLREGVCALKACKTISSLPTIVCMVFQTTVNGGRTPMGNSAEQCAKVLTEEGADAIGANCGTINPDEMADIIALLAVSTKLPLAAEPNAGKPLLVGSQTVFNMGPREFTSGLLRCKDAGATILGGCCGTTPAHIWALAQSLHEQ